MIQINYNAAGLRQQTAAIVAEARNPRAALAAGGRELSNRFKAWFRQRDRSSANKLSTRRSHFSLEVAQSVSAPFQSGYNEISVRVSDPRIAQKVFGGPIVPKEAGALTIPVEERAYGRTAATFEAETGLRLFVVKKKDGGGGGGGRGGLLAVAENGGITVEYVLSGGLTQEADPDALPPRGELEKAIAARMQSVVDRQRGS